MTAYSVPGEASETDEDSEEFITVRSNATISRKLRSVHVDEELEKRWMNLIKEATCYGRHVVQPQLWHIDKLNKAILNSMNELQMASFKSRMLNEKLEELKTLLTHFSNDAEFLPDANAKITANESEKT